MTLTQSLLTFTVAAALLAATPGVDTALVLRALVTHGARRAAEMAESAVTLDELGVEPLMTRATVRRQSVMAGRTDLLGKAGTDTNKGDQA